ncbi:hypothetical protein PUN4_830067 [Paraburkholderia unamae]|nr:hypothetical protein PUN4_830067 [Paraburkholderia unamae]
MRFHAKFWIPQNNRAPDPAPVDNFVENSPGAATGRPRPAVMWDTAQSAVERRNPCLSRV